MTLSLLEGVVPACSAVVGTVVGTGVPQQSGPLTAPSLLSLPSLIRGIREREITPIALKWTLVGPWGRRGQAGTPLAAVALGHHSRAPARVEVDPLSLRWERVSRQRVDLQDNTRWPAPVNPHGRGSSRQRWWNIASGVGWCLVLVEDGLHTPGGCSPVGGVQ